MPVQLKFWDKKGDKDDCETSIAAINGHRDYDGPDIKCYHVSALLPFGGEIATNWGIRW